MHAVAVAAASAKNRLAMGDYDDNKFQLATGGYTQNIQRSSSHESHLRNKIMPALPTVVTSSPRKAACNINNNNNTCNSLNLGGGGKVVNSSSENIYGDDYGPSGK